MLLTHIRITEITEILPNAVYMFELLYRKEITSPFYFSSRDMIKTLLGKEVYFNAHRVAEKGNVGYCVQGAITVKNSNLTTFQRDDLFGVNFFHLIQHEISNPSLSCANQTVSWK